MASTFFTRPHGIIGGVIRPNSSIMDAEAPPKASPDLKKKKKAASRGPRKMTEVEKMQARLALYVILDGVLWG